MENTTIICVGNITAGGTGKTPAVQYFAKKMLMENKKVEAIKRLREATGMGLKEAKDYVDSL